MKEAMHIKESVQCACEEVLKWMRVIIYKMSVIQAES